MKQVRANKMLGLAIGERSLTAAEVVPGEGKPQVRRLGEFVYPDGVSLSNPAALGKALGVFLRDNKFTTKSVVVGVPTKWVVAKAKELPPANASTAADMLRLQAEGDFSAELKDLVYDYAGEADPSSPKTVLLMATASKYVEQAVAMCEAAKLEVASVTVSSATLGAVTGRAVGDNVVVLSLASGGSELTAQAGDAPSVIRHLRGPSPQAPFVNEVRRALSLLPAHGADAAREMIVWDGSAEDPAGPVDKALNAALGMKVSRCDLGTLGVNTVIAAGNGAANGSGRRYAAAVALALAAGENRLPVDFLHSRLAPPKPARIPRWVITSVIAAVLLIGLGIYAYYDLESAQTQLTKLKATAAGMDPNVKAAEAFNAKVSFAQGWHGGDERYLACLKALAVAIPEDHMTVLTSLQLRDLPRPTNSNSTAKLAPIPRTIVGRLSGKTVKNKAVLILEELKKRKDVFQKCEFRGAQQSGDNEETFQIEFTYDPPVKPATK